MIPVGPLMVEHRLIERMLSLIAAEARRIRSTGCVDADFVISAVDFIRTYADRCHHGKEEDILFRELKKKPLSPEHRVLLAGLETEHKMGRDMVRQLGLARERFLQGDRASAQELAALMERLVAFYPEHIEKEDHHFFVPCMDYFTPEEQEQMLEECREFDRKLVHQLYEKLVLGFEGQHQSTVAPGTGPDDAPAGRYTCTICGYTYDPRSGDPVGNVPPGVPFQELPEGWICPHCHAPKGSFIKAKN